MTRDSAPSGVVRAQEFITGGTLESAARPRTAGVIAEGAIACSCFGVRHDRLIARIRDGLATPQAIGAKLRARTNCGLCVSELEVLIAPVARTT
jgi:NAD(P)H-nitrite reductase large subunit